MLMTWGHAVSLHFAMCCIRIAIARLLCAPLFERYFKVLVVSWMELDLAESAGPSWGRETPYRVPVPSLSCVCAHDVDFWPRCTPCVPQLEGREFTITEKGPFSFEIDFDTSACGTFVSGYVNQVQACIRRGFFGYT